MAATRTQIYLTEDQRQRLDATARREGRTLAGVIRDAVDDYQATPPRAAASTTTPSGVRPIFGDAALRREFVALRERRGLVRVQAIWAGDYGAEELERYFHDEDEWLSRAENRDVKVERLVDRGLSERPHEGAIARRLAGRHPQLDLYHCDEPSLAFELYLCEYNVDGKGRVLAGTLVVLNKLNRSPEFGVLMDGNENATMNAFLYSLRTWFECLRRTPVLDSEASAPGNVWTQNAALYDRSVDRETPLPMLRAILRHEDAVLESLIESISGRAALLEFGSGTGRSVEWLATRANVREKLAVCVGLDNAFGMNQVARAKRGVSQSGAHYLSVAGEDAVDYFWNGRAHVTEDIADSGHGAPHPFDEDLYAASSHVVTCLCNTVGVLDPSVRTAFMKNMFRAVGDGPNERVVISLFAGEHFKKYARRLYEGIHQLVLADISESCFDDITRTFRAGNYYSHWLDDREARTMIAEAGGNVSAVRPVELDGEVVGRIYVCTRA